MVVRRVLRFLTLVWLVSLHAVWPFLHAHAHGADGAAFGFLHVHIPSVDRGVDVGPASEPHAETFHAQEGKRLDLTLPLRSATTVPPGPVDERRVRLADRADPSGADWRFVLGEPRAPPAAA